MGMSCERSWVKILIARFFRKFGQTPLASLNIEPELNDYRVIICNAWECEVNQWLEGRCWHAGVDLSVALVTWTYRVKACIMRRSHMVTHHCRYYHVNNNHGLSKLSQSWIIFRYLAHAILLHILHSIDWLTLHQPINSLKGTPRTTLLKFFINKEAQMASSSFGYE